MVDDRRVEVDDQPERERGITEPKLSFLASQQEQLRQQTPPPPKKRGVGGEIPHQIQFDRSIRSDPSS